MPEIIQTLSGYKFTWVTEKITISVSRVRLHTDGRIAGDVQMVLGSKQQQEPSFNFNFSSATTRKQLINSLNQKYPEWKWLEIIDEVCRQVQRLAQEGEPVRELWTSEDMKPPEYLLEPILLKGLPTVIFGEKGVAKSTLALVFYTCLTLPWDDNPLGLTSPARSVKTVILDYELPGNIAQWNLKKLQEGNGTGALPLYHRRCYTPLADDIEAVSRYLGEAHAEVVIIDSLARAAGGELSKDTENANRFFNALDKLNVTSLIIAQTAKNDEQGKRKTIYGNALFTYYARSIFELCKSESMDNEMDVALFHRWSNLTALHKPMGFKFIFNGNKTVVEGQPVTYSQFLEKVSGQMQIIELLKTRPLSTQDIMDELGMKRGSLDTNLKRLRDRKKIVKLPDNTWGLAELRFI